MFYGFPSKGERAKDREKYRPWDGGVYGGSLTFSAEEHSYTIYRVFGKTKNGSGDEFRLLDEETRQESGRWSSAIGEELFGLNEESFANSAWIRQEGCTVTGDMAARLGGQPELLGDMKQFDRVMEGIEKHLNRLSPSRKTGLLYRKHAEQQELEAELLKAASLEQRVQQLSEEKLAGEQQLAELEQRLTKLQNTQSDRSAWQDYLAMKEMHDALQREYLKRDEIWELHQQKFPDGIPDSEELEAAIPDTEIIEEEDLDGEETEGPSYGIKSRILFAAGGVLLIGAALSGFAVKVLAAVLLAAGLLLLGLGGLEAVREKKEQSDRQDPGEGMDSGKGRGDRREWDQEQFRSLLIRQREAEAARTAWEELQRADRELRAFYEKYPRFEELSEQTMPSGMETIPSLTGLSEQVRETQLQIRAEEQKIRELDRRLGLLLEERNQLTEKEEKLELLKEEVTGLEKDYRITEITADHLRAAKEAFSSQFTAPVQRAFLAYYRLIDPEQKEELYLDSEYRICTMGGGLPRAEEVLSRGYRNLAALCLRIALLDVMYEKEPPVIIMDDPFVHFDDRKYERAMRFLAQIADRYQILYLSCREDRQI